MDNLTTIEVPEAPVDPPKITLDLHGLKYAVMSQGFGNEVSAIFKWSGRAREYRDAQIPGNRIINIETGEVL